jgi:hypothetical protein
MSAESGKQFEFEVQQYLLLRGVPCLSPDRLVKGKKSNAAVCRPLLDKLWSKLCELFGKPVSFAIYKDAQGEAKHGGHSADLHIEFVADSGTGNHCYLSLKNNSLELKAQRLRSLPSQMGENAIERGFKEELDHILEQVCKKYEKARIFAELDEYEKLQVYRSINDCVARHIRRFAKENDDHSRYINFLRGGDTQWILVNHKYRSMSFYRLPEFADGTKIAEVDELGDSIFVVLSNECTFRLRLHNDDRPFNVNMKMKYSTTMVGMNKICAPIYEITFDGISVRQKSFTAKEQDAIKREVERRTRIFS